VAGVDLTGAVDELQPADFATEVHRQVETATSVRPTGSLSQLEATFDRLEKLFMWGHLSDEKYRAERERLEAVRADLAAASDRAPPIVLDNILDAWNDADNQGRREMLGALFDELDVADNRIVGYKPRCDYETDVAALMECVFERRTAVRGCSMVGREGVEPPQLSRRFYRPLGSPRALCRPTAAVPPTWRARLLAERPYGTQPGSLALRPPAAPSGRDLCSQDA
jgi:hypothetical protein